VYSSGELIALAHTFGRTIASREGEMTVMGLANVCVAQRERGRGCGRVVTQAAFARVQQGDFPLALFQTTPEVEPFYWRLGCIAVRNRFCNSLAADPHANPFWDPIAMRYPATIDWTESDIDIRGPGY
jgi:predicted GNAT family N-acyltransferase